MDLPGSTSRQFQIGNNIARPGIGFPVFDHCPVVSAESPGKVFIDPRVASAECIGFGIQVASGCVGHNVWVQQFEIGSFVPANRFDFSGPVSGMPPDSGSGIQVEVTFGPESSLPVSAPLLYDNGFLFIFVFSA